MQRLKRAEAEADSLKILVTQYKIGGSKEVMKLRLNQEYIDNIKLMGKNTNNVIIKNDISDVKYNVDISTTVLRKDIV